MEPISTQSSIVPQSYSDPESIKKALSRGEEWLQGSEITEADEQLMKEVFEYKEESPNQLSEEISKIIERYEDAKIISESKKRLSELQAGGLFTAHDETLSAGLSQILRDKPIFYGYKELSELNDAYKKAISEKKSASIYRIWLRAAMVLKGDKADEADRELLTEIEKSQITNEDLPRVALITATFKQAERTWLMRKITSFFKKLFHSKTDLEKELEQLSAQKDRAKLLYTLEEVQDPQLRGLILCYLEMSEETRLEWMVKMKNDIRIGINKWLKEETDKLKDTIIDLIQRIEIVKCRKVDQKEISDELDRLKAIYGEPRELDADAGDVKHLSKEDLQKKRTELENALLRVEYLRLSPEEKALELSMLKAQLGNVLYDTDRLDLSDEKAANELGEKQLELRKEIFRLKGSEISDKEMQALFKTTFDLKKPERDQESLSKFEQLFPEIVRSIYLGGPKLVLIESNERFFTTELSRSNTKEEEASKEAVKEAEKLVNEAYADARISVDEYLFFKAYFEIMKEPRLEIKTIGDAQRRIHKIKSLEKIEEKKKGLEERLETVNKLIIAQEATVSGMSSDAKRILEENHKERKALERKIIGYNKKIIESKLLQEGVALKIKEQQEKALSSS